MAFVYQTQRSALDQFRHEQVLFGLGVLRKKPKVPEILKDGDS